MPVKLNSSGGGSVTLTTPSTASDFTVTVPAVTGSALVSTSGSSTSSTGIDFPSANTVSIKTNGTTAVTVDSSQNVGIGTTGPGAKFDVSGGFIQVTDTTGSGGYRMRIGAGGPSGSPASLAYIEARDSLPLAFYTSTTERARIDSSGNLLVGTTSLLTGSPRLNIQSTGSYTATLVQSDNADRTLMRCQNNWATSSNNSTMLQFVDATGTERGTIKTSTTATSYNTSSDYRLKENVQPMSGALTKVTQLNPVTFNWKINGSHGQGFIAHELQAVIPDAVTGEKDAVDGEGNPKYQGVDTSFLVATLTAAIQELSAKLDAAEARIAALEGAK